jgi:hypothetical protein
MGESFDSTSDLKLAVVTGHHPFDVPRFADMFYDMPGVRPYMHDMCEFSTDVAKVRGSYDAVLFYMMRMPTPGDERDWFDKNIRPAMEQLGTTAQGIVILHHSILAFREWQHWSDLVGIDDRSIKSYHDGEQVTSQIVDTAHPITRGIEPWTMTDETYVVRDAGEGNQILITYDNPKSMKTIAWVRQFGEARVFCYVAGHDARTYQDASFREVLRRGIAWAAHRLD